MALIAALSKWLVRIVFVIWLLVLILFVLKFYKDNPGSIELTFYQWQLSLPLFVVGLMPLLLAALACVLFLWVLALRVRLKQSRNRAIKAKKALEATLAAGGKHQPSNDLLVASQEGASS